MGPDWKVPVMEERALKKGAQMPRAKAAVFLGILSFFLMFIIGEPASEQSGNAGLVLMFVIMAAYFFLCQFRLSRGNPNAYRKDWPVMLALDAVWIIVGFTMILSERREVVISQGLGILISCFGATWAGAFAASMKARGKREQI